MSIKKRGYYTNPIANLIISILVILVIIPIGLVIVLVYDVLHLDKWIKQLK